MGQANPHFAGITLYTARHHQHHITDSTNVSLKQDQDMPSSPSAEATMMAPPSLRSWSWTRIDGRNVLAMPTRDEIELYDSSDFVLLDTLAPSGHRTAIHTVRWSAFHGRLASLSRTQLIVHAPRLEVDDRGPSGGDERVRFERLADWDLVECLAGVRSLAFSRSADLLLAGGPAGIAMLDLRDDVGRADHPSPVRRLVWSAADQPCDIVKVSPCSFVLAAFTKHETTVRVWRLGRADGDNAAADHDPDNGRTGPRRREVLQTETLAHPEPVVYASWKPATTPLHAARELDGRHVARWFEPPRMLLTCTAGRTIRIWIETCAVDDPNASDSPERRQRHAPVFTQALLFEPPSPLSNVRWVLSKNRNISEEKFQIRDQSTEAQVEWLSGVDASGVLHLYQVTGLASADAKITDTRLRVKVNGEDDHHDGAQSPKAAAAAMRKEIQLVEICVMAYFSQDYFGLPSKFDVVLQRTDGILLSYIITVGRKHHVAHVKKKSWYRRHTGSLAALAAHPSLPLVASVDEHRRADGTWGHEILIFWVAFSAFSAQSRLIPSGVLECPPENGEVLCVQWVSTLHFDATPLLLVTYKSGVVDVFGRTANARAVVSSPRMHGKRLDPRLHSTRSPSLSPWTFYDYLTGASRVEYEVTKQKKVSGLGFTVVFNDGRTVVDRVIEKPTTTNGQIAAGDEVITVNSVSLNGKDPHEFHNLVEGISLGESVVVRLRSSASDGANKATPHESKTSRSPPKSIEEHAAELRNSFLSSVESEFNLDPSYVHAGSVSMYGGWYQILSSKISSSFGLVCVCPVYEDDGEFVPGTVLLFAVSSLPGQLSVWKGFHSNSSQDFHLEPLVIQDASVLKKTDITSIAGEKDYRQRAFTNKGASKRQRFNSLIFIGDAEGCIQHWRCRVSGNRIRFTMMSSCCMDAAAKVQCGDLSRFCRRGYIPSRLHDLANHTPRGVFHIEVDDPNRIAVLDASEPETLHVYEGESGLGILRLEESLKSNGRGRVIGFCWCNAHVEFNVDALAVHYESSIVIYQYDMKSHRWTQVGNDIVTNVRLFDCTRDSSALLVGGGNWSQANPHKPEDNSEEMPVVLGKWDEPGNLLQHSMDWKAHESPQKLPVWHPFVVITTLFGMHARVGLKDTALATDAPLYEFSKAFRDAVQMLKLLAKVVVDDGSAKLSARSGVLAYVAKQESNGLVFMSHIGRRDSIGRYSTSIHVDTSINKAENLFGYSDRSRFSATNCSSGSVDSDNLTQTEEATLMCAVDSLLTGSDPEGLKRNASMLFRSFEKERLLELKAIVAFVKKIQSLGFELDASAADLGAKRYYSMFLFSQCLKTIYDAQAETCLSATSELDTIEMAVANAAANETPSSGVLWALHSDAQQFLWEHCIEANASWEDIRPMWLGLWVRDVKDLRSIVERLAKATYMRSKDAMEVALFYVALGKNNILAALAKLSKLDTNKNLAMFLENDFSQERWSNAAIKNAYSLLSKKQYQTAAAFFLLCQPPRLQEALRLIAIRLQDPSQALIVARLVEYRTSDQFKQDFISAGLSRKEITPLGTVTKALVEEDLVPLFRKRQERWLESCALWWLESFEQACTVLMPQAQATDVAYNVDPSGSTPLSSSQRSRFATFFFVNLTSIPIYFQHLYSSSDATLVSWAIKKILLNGASADVTAPVAAAAARRHKLASTADIEHAFSFSAYVCKRSGMSDTSVVQMLQARHLINLHSKSEPSPDCIDEDTAISAAELPRSPRMASLGAARPPLLRQGSLTTSSERNPRWTMSPRRMSELNHLDFAVLSPVAKDLKGLLIRSSTVNWSQAEKPPSLAPWLKAQIADIECRKWSSSAFVGKMIGIRVAREMITHFRAELDACFRHFIPGMPLRAERHRDFLEELCAPLCEQFQVDRTYVFEAALAVMQPHAYLHLAEICFLLAILGRNDTLTKWIQYVALSMLNSCSTFASCRITEDIYRDWESLTIQLCFLLHLDAQRQIKLPHAVVAQVSVAVRMGCVFLSWCRQQWTIVHEAIKTPFYSKVSDPGEGDDIHDYFSDLSAFSFDKNVELLRALQKSRNEKYVKEMTSNGGSFGYLFLKTVAAHRLDDRNCFAKPSEKNSEHKSKLHKMYTLIAMVSILRTLYARAQVFLFGCLGESDPHQGAEEIDISSSLFTPRKLWKPLTDGPLDGLRQWYSLIESHLRCEFDYSVKEITCLCGLYGLDGKAGALTRRLDERIADFEASSQADEQRPHHAHHHHLHLPFLHKHGDNIPHHTLSEYLGAMGISDATHRMLLGTSDDYMLLLMKHPRFGISPSLRRFRLDPRVHVQCFLLKDAFEWFTATTNIFSSNADARHFLSRCCKQRKLRLLVKRRGDDAYHFPPHHDPQLIDPETSSVIESSDTEQLIESVAYHAMMFVDPWEIEAERNVSHYMHHDKIPLHVELGWDRLSPICTETSDEIAQSVFDNSDLVEMWRSTCGEGWLVTSITQYQLDGVRSHRSADVDTSHEVDQVPFLVEVHSRCQRNALFKEVGLPHRFVGNVKVKLIAGRELIPVKWIDYFTDPYVFFALSPDPHHSELVSDSWSIQTYRSRCAPGGQNPVWNHQDEDEFVFRFAIPTHRSHVHGHEETSEDSATPTEPSSPHDAVTEHPLHMSAASQNGSGMAGGLWDSVAAGTSDAAPLEALESLLHSSFMGPPLFLHCAAYHKTKVLAHHFMGRGMLSLASLTSGSPIDAWIPLEGVPSGSLHVQVSLSFQLMCSSTGSGKNAAHSASTYHRPIYEWISDHSDSTSTDREPTTGPDLSRIPPPRIPTLVPRLSGSKF